MAIELSLKFWMGLLLGALIVAFVFIPLAKSLWSLLPPNVDESTYASFLELDKKLIEVSQGSRSEIELPFYLKPSVYILIGFNKECSRNQNDNKCPAVGCYNPSSDYYIQLPDECALGRSCLCLYDKNRPVICRSYSDIDYLVGNTDSILNEGNGINIQGTNYESFALYGKCKEEFGARKLKLERKLIDENILIHVTVL